MAADGLTVAGVLDRQHRRGDQPLLVCDHERLTYAAAEHRSAELARGLLALGVGKGTHVGLWYPNGAQFVVATLAAARIGAVVVPFSTFLTATELRDQLVRSDVTVLLAATAYRNHDYRQRVGAALGVDVNEFDGTAALFTTAAPVLRHILFDTDALARRGAATDPALLAATEADVAAADVLAIVYTSGSTGRPKGAVHTHGALLEHQANLNAIRGLTASDILFSNSPFCWIGGFAFSLLSTFIAGATLVCSNATDAAVTLDLLEAEKPTVGNGFAAGIAHLSRHPSFTERDLSSLRRGNLYPLMPVDVRPADPELRHNMLGMTETGSVALIDRDDTDQPESRRGSFGRLAPGFEAQVIDSELWLRGPYLMQRYYGLAREDCFDAHGWFHTGDLVRVDADGFFYFLGRAGSMIKTAGANVAPPEVEAALTRVLADRGVAGVHVFGLPDPVRGQIVAAVIALEDPSAFDPAATSEALRATLSAYKIPKRFAACRPAEVPVLSSGKIDIAGLAGLFDA
ncbi:class I adenylate-forming enzyme family protein [[Mycobacterium] burgundiense]|uniref:Class I adenylate-forming enzyme family protein n=1 Tax=[Mycobacterium] burgundiense TaxID=3064286 RepID=A0ABN9MVH3_9MYCO|nr:class I adenylate-forming enzyme family protein [Mycolicibacterium sp. MU0053]CAJ1495957.1 class I adenylate-forming enzyme family protein [Mycolicibacterium sp. MU0053]